MTDQFKSSFCDRGDHRKCREEGFAGVCSCTCGHPDGPSFLDLGGTSRLPVGPGQVTFVPGNLRFVAAGCANNFPHNCDDEECSCFCHMRNWPKTPPEPERFFTNPGPFRDHLDPGYNIISPREATARLEVKVDRYPSYHSAKPDSMRIEPIGDGTTIRVTFVHGHDELRFEGPRANMQEVEPQHDPGQVTAITVNFVGFTFTGRFLTRTEGGGNNE